MITIIPYETVGQIRFGMSKDEVIDTLGAPQMVSNRYGESILRYGGQNVIIGHEGVVVEVTMPPETPVAIRGVTIFSDPNAFSKLCRIDGDPQESVGFIILYNLGITMAGFHDMDEEQKTVGAFARGRWDMPKSEMTPFRPEGP